MCAEVDDVLHGMIATSFAVGISFCPPLVLFSAQRTSRTWPRIATAASVGVSVLSEGNVDVVYAMASRDGDRFAATNISRTAAGAVFIEGAVMWLECQVHSTSELGDHVLVVLEVRGASSRPGGQPLTYHQGALRPLVGERA